MTDSIDKQIENQIREAINEFNLKMHHAFALMPLEIIIHKKQEKET